MNLCLGPSTSDLSGGEDDDELSPELPPIPPAQSESVAAVRPCTSINETEARMSVVLTEYFQQQRKVYEQVSIVHKSQALATHYQPTANLLLLTYGACMPLFTS